MEIQTLRARIQPALHQDFDAVREEFVAETGTEDHRAFVHHLREWELIPYDLANTLLIELAVERASDEEDESEDPTIIMQWDDASAEVDPEAATKYQERPELLDFVDDPSADLALDADEVGPEGRNIDPEADTVHLERRIALGEESPPQKRLPPSPEPGPTGTLPLEQASVVVSSLPGREDQREASNRSPVSAPERCASEVPTLVEGAPPRSEQPLPHDLPTDPTGRFQFLEILDQDALARTVLALDTRIGRHVALRALHASMRQEPDAHPTAAQQIHRFRAEAHATSQLDHPGIPAVYEYQGPDAYFHRLMDGDPLTNWLIEARSTLEARRPLPPHLTPDALLDRFVQVCDILAHAHARGLIHRDLRPDNVLVGPHGATWVVDWGIALVVDEAAPNAIALDEAPESRLLMGTAGYCSPEQANGRQKGLDARSDVYALGLLLFEILALRPAVGTPAVSARLARQQQGQLDPLVHAFGHPIPPELRAIVARATAIDPSQRYPSAVALADDVRRAIRGQPISALRDGPLTAIGRLFARHPASVLGVLVLLVLGWTLTLILAVILYTA